MPEKELTPEETLKWMKIISGGIIIIYFFSKYLPMARIATSSVGSGFAFGNNIWILICGAINIFCGRKCFELAREHKRNIHIAYMMGFFFSLLGWLVYWTYVNFLDATKNFNKIYSSN